MPQVLITGATGFVGQNLMRYLDGNYSIKKCGRSELQRADLIEFKGISSVIHLAGKSHDVKKTSDHNEYYEVNYKLTKQLYDAFLLSSAIVFVFMSSVKAAADKVTGVLTEEVATNPQTHYGKSKLLAEQYILSKEVPEGKRVYILRPCMVHGIGNKGNLNLLYSMVSKGIPWPLGSFHNERSFCSIDNLMTIIKEIIEREDIPSGVYNVADDEPLSTNQVIALLAESQNRNPKILMVAKSFIQVIAKLGNILRLPLNEERLHKLTESYVVSNYKLITAIGKPLPVLSKEGLLKTFKSFH
jgi:nucleoside-diphosphate-sugar epimerase